jgi:hypothetical protein
MSIKRVEYDQEQRAGMEGVVITFTYEGTIPGTDLNVADAYEVFGDDFPVMMNILQMSANPEHLMINIRNLLRLTVH